MAVIKNLSQWVHRISSGRMTLAALVIFFLFTILVLPGQTTDVGSEKDIQLPDLSFFYTPGDLYNVADVLGESGRAAYIRARFTFDVIWPIVYTAFLATVISWLTHKLSPDAILWSYANLLPVLGALCDFGENISTSVVMARYPTRAPVTAFTAMVFTPLKWILIGTSFGVLVFLLVKLILQKVKPG